MHKSVVCSETASGTMKGNYSSFACFQSHLVIKMHKRRGSSTPSNICHCRVSKCGLYFKHSGIHSYS